MTVSQKFLLFDERNIHELRGARMVVNQPTRHPANPLFGGESGLWDKSKGERGRLVSVMRDEEDQLFKAWFAYGCGSGYASDTVAPWRRTAYIESHDGIHWDRSKMQVVEWEGASRSDPLQEGDSGVVFKDPSEAIAERRFKMVFKRDDSNGGVFCQICVAYSADGIHWRVPRLPYSRYPDPAINRPVNPIIAEGTDALVFYSWYWDPYLRRYVGLLRPVWNIPRRICMTESDDFVH